MKRTRKNIAIRGKYVPWNALTSVGLVLLLSLPGLLTGCGNGVETTQGISEPIRIGSLSGPTGIGMVHLMEAPGQYDIAVFQTPDEVSARVISGELEVAALPSNLAAVLFNKLEGDVVLLATNTLGTLYILENGGTLTGVDDLRGRTILASGRGGTPEYILSQILTEAGMDPEADVTIDWLTSHADVAAALASQDGAIAMLPEPFATVVTSKNQSVTSRLDLDREWQAATDTKLPMGVLVAQRSFVESRGDDLAMFLKAYGESVEKVNEDPAGAALLVAKHGIIADAAVAEKAIPGCNIVYVPAQDGRDDLEKFFGIISAMNPKSIGGRMPDETFYYRSEK